LRFCQDILKTLKKIPVLCFKASETYCILLRVIYISESCRNTASSCHIYQSERDLLGPDSSFVWHMMLRNIYHDKEWWKQCFRAVFPKLFCSWNPFWLRKVTADSHVLAHVNTECPDDWYPKLKNVYLRTDFR
jgi:hypothetical protein